MTAMRISERLGHTLSELITVLVIIAILAGIFWYIYKII
jgi:prepilin-type N-terminal cleavage/methylation domain-containing protein